MNISKKYTLPDNCWGGNDPNSIMLHTTLGSTVIGAYETLKSRGLSYNYLISEGQVYELVPFTHSAWHAGVTHGVNMRAQVFYRGENPNKHSVGIAFVQPEGVTTLPEVDINACIELIKYIGQQTGVRYNADNIFYHREVTDYKPIQVKFYREEVLDALVGDKDHKDATRKHILELTVQLLQLKLELLLKQLSK